MTNEALKTDMPENFKVDLMKMSDVMSLFVSVMAEIANLAYSTDLPEEEAQEQFTNYCYGLSTLFLPDNPNVIFPENYSLQKVVENGKVYCEGLMKEDEIKTLLNDPPAFIPVIMSCYVTMVMQGLSEFLQRLPEDMRQESFEAMYAMYVQTPDMSVTTFDFLNTLLEGYPVNYEGFEVADEKNLS